MKVWEVRVTAEVTASQIIMVRAKTKGKAEELAMERVVAGEWDIDNPSGPLFAETTED